jgi:phage baseplate assembly protein gpV
LKLESNIVAIHQLMTGWTSKWLKMMETASISTRDYDADEIDEMQAKAMKPGRGPVHSRVRRAVPPGQKGKRLDTVVE